MGVINEPRYDEDLVTKSYLDKTIENTTGTIDGELSKLDSSVSRRAQNFGSEPTPPYYVNDTYMDGADIYICTTERLIGDFNAADWGKASDYTNDDFVNSLNKIFKDEPVPPYKPGDLWPVGPGGALYKCKTAKVLGEPYSIGDWELATKYDNMDDRVTAEGGFLTAGTIQVVQGGTGLVAGMTGQTSGDTAVRFWAGSTFDNRVNAPFRVTQAGAVTATSGSISGNLIASGINASNITAGTLSTARLNSDVITTTNFSAQNINASKITTGTLTGRAISGGSINIGSGKFTVNTSGVMSATGATISGTINATSGTFANFSGGGLTLNSSGAFKYYDRPGFLYCGGNTTNHPYVSALNVAAISDSPGSGNNPGNQSISFRNSDSRTTAGSTIAYISHGWNGSTRFHTINNMNISSSGATGITAGTYLVTNAGTYTQINSGTYTQLTAGNQSSGQLGTNTGSVYIASANTVNSHINIKAHGYIYAGSYAAAGNYNGARVTTASGNYSSKNVKKNIKKFKKNDYKEAIDLLEKLNIYNYTYKYTGFYKRKKQYGFILDEIKTLDNKFFDIIDEVGEIKDGGVDFSEINGKGKKIIVKNYNPDVLDKYLLTVCKAQQMKIDELEKRLEKLEGGK